VAVADGEPALRVFDLTGGEARTVLDGPSPCGYHQFVAWSHDGQSLLLACNEGGVLRVELDGRTRLLWTSPHRAFAPRPSPDGRRLVLTVRPFDADVWLIEEP